MAPNIPEPGMLLDVKALNIPRQRDVKLNELAKQILMLLPLLLLLLLLLYVLYHVLIRGREAPPYNYVVSTYSRSSSRSSRGSSIKICFANSFNLTSLCLGILRTLTSANIRMAPLSQGFKNRGLVRSDRCISFST